MLTVHHRYATVNGQRLIAPDHLGFGWSGAPAAGEFGYTFDALAGLTADLLDQLGIDRYALYIQDYGAPVGWRLALANPEAASVDHVVSTASARARGAWRSWTGCRARESTAAAPAPPTVPGQPRWEEQCQSYQLTCDIAKITCRSAPTPALVWSASA